ncbi:hypothetical protein [Curtobacterium sp. PhB130]|uniref:hypothetical protein n=1 Tax=Curtobacterium sp. PhB130 TaxID=2485178 RepID=UPI0021A7AEB8|nr:hypothetical protein [Curtobacterium sp. PhB130]
MRGETLISSTPMPGDPWPHDMVITIEDSSHSLFELLWIREARDLDVEGDDLPPWLVATPGVEPPADATDRRSWSAAWPDMWRACLTHVAEERDPRVFDRLDSTPPGSPERQALLAGLFGPSWRDAFGDDAFTSAYDAWTTARFEEQTAPSRLRREPERDALDALVPAWRAGLRNVVVIPCRGRFTRRIGDHALLVTAETRDVTDDYAEALRSFARAT